MFATDTKRRRVRYANDGNIQNSDSDSSGGNKKRDSNSKSRRSKGSISLSNSFDKNPIISTLGDIRNDKSKNPDLDIVM